MDELGHTYIPKVLPGSSSHEISSPTVGYLMSHYLINKKKKLMCIHIYIFFHLVALKKPVKYKSLQSSKVSLVELQ